MTTDHDIEARARRALAAAHDRQAIAKADHAVRLNEVIQAGRPRSAAMMALVDNARARMVDADMDVADSQADLSRIVRIRQRAAEPSNVTGRPPGDGWVETHPGSGIWHDPADPLRRPGDLYRYYTQDAPDSRAAAGTPDPVPEGHLASEAPTIGDMTVTVDRLDDDDNALVVQVDGYDTVILRGGAHPRQVTATVYSPTTCSPFSSPFAVTIPRDEPTMPDGPDSELVGVTVAGRRVTVDAHHDTGVGYASYATIAVEGAGIVAIVPYDAIGPGSDRTVCMVSVDIFDPETGGIKARQTVAVPAPGAQQDVEDGPL